MSTDDFFGDGNPYIKKDDTGKTIPYKEEKNYALETLSNVPSSAKTFFEAVFMPVTDPVGFVTGIASLGDSILGLAGITDGDPATARAVGKHFAQRYGSVDGFKEAFKTDPIGIISDISVVLTLGGTAGIKSSQIAGNLAKQSTKGNQLINAVNKGSTTAVNVGNAIDPLTGSIQLMNLPIVRNALQKSSLLVTAPLSIATGKSIDAIESAFDAGLSGGKKQESFKNQFSGKGTPDDLVNQAIAGLQEMKNAMQRTYNNGMTGLAMSQKIVPDFAGKLRKIKQNYIDKHMVFDATVGKKVLKLPPGAEPFFKQVDDIIETAINNTQNYTYGALDDVKKSIDKASPNAFNSTNANATDALTIRNDVKDLIVKEIPEYADVMKGYETANQVKTQIEKQMSLGTNIKEIANIDTTYRKLLSAMNDGVNANFGSRINQVNKIDPTGEIKAGISGAMLNQALPSNITGRLLGGGLGVAGASSNPLSLLALPAFSPKIVGGTANLLGTGMRLGNNLSPLANPSAFVNRNFTQPSLLSEPLTSENALTYGMNRTKTAIQPSVDYLRGLLMGD